MDVFRDDLAAATTKEAKASLAARLVRTGVDSRNATERYVLRDVAMRLLVQAGEIEGVVQQVDALAAEFSIDRPRALLSQLTMLVPTVPPNKAGAVVELACRLAEEAVREHEYALADDCFKTAITAAKKSTDKTTVPTITKRQKAVKDLARKAKEVEASIAVLAANPNDADAALVVGKFRCFVEDRWDLGLPLLARSADSQLVELASKELGAAGQATPALTLAAADGWFEWGRDRPVDEKAAAEVHAGMLYRSVMDRLSGLEKARVEKRLGQAQPAMAGDTTVAVQKLKPLLWLNASDRSTLRTDADRPVGDAPGTPVVAWLDKSGAGHHFRSTGPQTSPTLLQLDRKGAALRFDGVDDYLVSGDWPSTLAPPLTILMAVMMDRRVWDKKEISMLLDNCHDSAAGFTLMFRGELDGHPLQIGPKHSVFTPFPQDPAWHVIAAVLTDGESSLFIDGKPAAREPGIAMGAAQPALFLGAWGMANGNARGRFLAGAIGDVVVVSRALSAAEIAGASAAMTRGLGK